MATENSSDGAGRSWRYVPALDGVRAVAVGLVVAFHTYVELVTQRALLPIGWTPVPGAAFGVDMFFALSGFLITGLLLSEHRSRGRIDFRAFYIRRALRLLPALILLLITTTVYAVLANEGVGTQLSSVLPVLFYVGNWMPALGVTVSPLLLHTWSLSVEEQFYILWPSIVAWWYLRRRWSFAGLACGLLAISFAYSFDVWFRHGNVVLLYLNTLARAGPLVIGALGAYLWATRSAPRHVGLLAWSAIVLLAWLVCNHGSVGGGKQQFLGWPLVGLATTMLIIAIVGGWRGAAVLGWTPIRAVGRVSYGIYLWHAPVFIIVELHGRSLSAGQRILIAYAITTVVVLTSWFCVERPFLARKPRPAAQPPTPSSVTSHSYEP